MATESENKEQPKNKYRHSKKTGFYYSFLTIILILCLIEIGAGAVINVSKIISYQGKKNVLENLLKKAQMRNQDLKSEKKMVTSDNSLEGIARNNLKMAGEDEVLIIINKKVETPKKKKHFWNLKGKFSFTKKQTKPEETNPNINIPQTMVDE